jgi:hypothetical protein
MSSSNVADRILNDKEMSFLHVTNGVAHMQDYPSIQQAVCLLLWEIAFSDPVLQARNSRKGQGQVRTRKLIQAGAITALLSAIDDHPMDLNILNCVVPVLRLMAAREPELCKAEIEGLGEESGDDLSQNNLKTDVLTEIKSRKPLMQILNELEANMDDICREAAQPGAPMPTKIVAMSADKLRADLTAVQGLLLLRINGKPVQHPQAKVPEESLLHGQYFHDTTDRHRRHTNYRAKAEIWSDMKTRAASEWQSRMQRRQLGISTCRTQAGWILPAN